MGWCSDFKTKRYAIGFVRHNPSIACTYPKRVGNERNEDNHCTVVENQHLYAGVDLQISGHCVVFDVERPGELPGFFDFQADGRPTSKLKEGELWITEHGRTAFAFPVDKNAMVIDG